MLTLSRSGIGGLILGFALLAIPYRHRIFSRQVLIPVGVVAVGFVALIATSPAYFIKIIGSRFADRRRLDVGALQRLRLHPDDPPLAPGVRPGAEQLRGLLPGGHRPGELGAALVLRGADRRDRARRDDRLRRLPRLPVRAHGLRTAARAPARRPRATRPATRVTPLAWGMTAALVGTLFANVFYLTMSFYYFYVFVTLLLALPIVYGPRAGAQARGARRLPARNRRRLRPNLGLTALARPIERSGRRRLMRELVVDGRRISEDGDCYVIAEVGHNHQGSLMKAIELLQAAKECGADAVKLQKRDNRDAVHAGHVRPALRPREQLRPHVRRAPRGARALRQGLVRADAPGARDRHHAVRHHLRPAERGLPRRARRAGLQDRLRRPRQHAAPAPGRLLRQADLPLHGRRDDGGRRARGRRDPADQRRSSA